MKRLLNRPDRSHEPATRGFVQKRIMQAATALAIVLLGTVMAIQVGNVNRSRGQCERGNVHNVASLRLVHDLEASNTARIKSVLRAQRTYADDLIEVLALVGFGPELGDVLLETTAPNVYARNQYRKDKFEFIASQADTAVAPYADRSDGVRSDCEAVYPYPPPLSLFL